MSNSRLTALVPILMALAMPLYAGEGDTTTPGPALTPEQEAFWQEFQSSALTKAQVEAESKYVTARAAFQDARFVEARELVEDAIRIFPSHVRAQQLRQDVLAVLSQRNNQLQMAASGYHAQQDVKTQEIAVRLAALMESGDAKMQSGDFAGAELDYDRVDVGLRSFPYEFDWGTLPTQVTAKKQEARAKAREAALAKQTNQRNAAVDRARELREVQAAALTAKVDELIARAKTSFARKDFKRAEVDAWNAYELDRRREDARRLYLSARRAGHNQFDDRYREVRLDRLARVQEEMHKSLVPQNEILVYPEDWQIRAMRRPQQLGSSTVEPWVAQLRERLEQRISVEMQDYSVEEAFNLLRNITGTNIVVDPSVTAKVFAPINLNLKDISFGIVLKWVLKQTDLNMALQNQAIYISSEPILGNINTRIYDITDIISPVKDHIGPELAYNAGSGGGGGGFALFQTATTEDTQSLEPDQFIEFIKENVAKSSWDSDAVSINMRGGSSLFVTQTPEVHALIDQLLTVLRNQASTQVFVEVRILDLRKNFFEEIGFQFTDVTQGAAANNLASTSPYPNLIDGTPDQATGDGYVRLNNTIAYNGALTQQMPGNVSTSTTQNNTARGLQIDASYHPFSLLGTDQVNALFTAFEQEQDVQLLEHQTLTCFNTKRAHTAFMNQYAYIADYEIVAANYDPVIQVLNYGNVLDVRPIVSADRKYITMDMRPTSVLPQSFITENLLAPRVLNGGGFIVFLGTVIYPIELPNLLVRNLRTTIQIPDKGTILMGGFATNVRQRTHSGIPFLSHIPFLGRLFSQNGVYDENRRLFFMVTAEIIDFGEKEQQQ